MTGFRQNLCPACAKRNQFRNGLCPECEIELSGEKDSVIRRNEREKRRQQRERQKASA